MFRPFFLRDVKAREVVNDDFVARLESRAAIVVELGSQGALGV
jgi:hypothetical protein